MSREVDLRRPVEEPDEQRLRTLARTVSEQLPGEQTARVAALDRLTGNAARVEVARGEAEPGPYAARALAHLRSVGPLLGLTATQPAEFVPDPVVRTTSAGAHTVHLRQQHQGIQVFQAAQAVVFDPSGTVASSAGRSVTIDQLLDAEPAVRVEAAVLAAARHVALPAPDELGKYDQFHQPFDPPAVDLDSYEPRVTTVLAGAQDRTTVLAAGPFAEPITAGLVWFPLGPGDIRLGWRVALTMPDHVQRFVVVVDAGDGTVLFAHQTVLNGTAVGDVHLIDGGRERERIAFPRALQDYRLESPPGLPAGFPDPWLSGDDTSGNNVVAHPGDADPPVRGTHEDAHLTFSPDPKSAEQRVLNAFALASSAHDFFYLLGFTEAEGNFQRDSLGRGGTGTDPVDARVYARSVPGTASMLTPVDGTSPVLRLGLVTSTDRHTALDASVVFHEFSHGVTNRLVGGGFDTHALDEPQSAGMGEGWGDYFACMHTGNDVVAAWVVDRTGGIRGHRYDERHPGHFGRLGIEYREVHEVGEVWCATLMEMTRRLGSDQLALSLVMDALKVSPPNPSFLDMRDAILSALADLRDAGQLPADRFAEANKAVWEAFARFGMGPGARSLGARLQGIKADFRTPEALEPTAEAVAPIYSVTVVLDADGEVREQHVARDDGEQTTGAEPPRADGGRQVQYFVETIEAVTPAGPLPADLRLEIVDLRFAQADPDKLTATFAFALTGADAARTADDQARYIVHVVVTSPEAWEARVVATTACRVAAGSTGGEVTLEFPAPPPGRYQLLGGIIVAPYEVLAVESGPALRVVP
ncbi:M36 family metallopeptidase [Paractinoplanes hotanensis]|uniref:M36 family metallopeptidase n=1 Tax=Paractinoplanes hotanensis TaxID=2906497 RepID=A0ABT0XYJ2_9ACTN|nr:M36 family metallopeptidase [Actinoplanes hotanensis]MCM4078853.1 M36 family metallopeptidase [Actinoplanes hotanensis]